MKIAVLGATGLVGRTMLQVLDQRGFGNPDQFQIIPSASPRSVGTTIPFAGRNLTVVSPQDAIDAHNTSEHFTRIVPQMGALVEQADPVELYTEVSV